MNNKGSDMSKITEDQANSIVDEMIERVLKNLKQEIMGNNEDYFDRIKRMHAKKMSLNAWKIAQKWSKWTEDGPVLMPESTRLYYRKGDKEIVVQEFSPQTRLLRFSSSLVNANSSEERVQKYSIPLPYVNFIFSFKDGIFDKVICTFLDRPLKTLAEKPMIPYFSNINNEFQVCLGLDFDRKQLIKDNISQQCAFILSYFWQSVFNNEWSGFYWENQSHFEKNDKRLSSLESWQKSGYENPLFVIDDVSWMQSVKYESFTEIIVFLLDENNNIDHKMRTDIFDSLTNDFVDDFQDFTKKNIDQSKASVKESILKELSDILVKKIESI